MPTATVDEFDLDIRLQDRPVDALDTEKYPPESAPVVCTTTRLC